MTSSTTRFTVRCGAARHSATRPGDESTARRDPGTPAWLPEFRKGAVVRFMKQDGVTGGKDNPWGKFRILFLQYPSDPITFFSPAAAWRAPDWMRRATREGCFALVCGGFRWSPCCNWRSTWRWEQRQKVSATRSRRPTTSTRGSRSPNRRDGTRPELARLRAFLEARDKLDK